MKIIHAVVMNPAAVPIKMDHTTALDVAENCLRSGEAQFVASVTRNGNDSAMTKIVPNRITNKENATNMNTEQIKTELLKHHKPDAWKHNMVWSVWEDGEITLEKGAELFGQRNLHLIFAGFLRKLPKEVMPIVESKHGRLYVDTEQEAVTARNVINDYLVEEITEQLTKKHNTNLGTRLA